MDLVAPAWQGDLKRAESFDEYSSYEYLSIRGEWEEKSFALSVKVKKERKTFRAEKESNMQMGSLSSV